MSTSRYSKSDIESPSNTDDYPEHHMKLRFPSHVAPNTRRTGLFFKAGFWALLLVDVLALGGSSDFVEAVTFSALTIINVAVMLHITK
jgi:hypothetical protein